MDPFIGEIRITPFDYAPYTWAYCDGAQLPVSQNTALFALLGSNYGGDWRTYFKLPDLRGRIPLGAGYAPGLTNRVIGQSGGSANVTLNAANLPVHDHQLVASSADATTDSPNGAAPAVTETASPYGDATTTNAVPMGVGTIGVTGSNAPHNNMPPVLNLTFIIALSGIFPSRP